MSATYVSHPLIFFITLDQNFVVHSVPFSSRVRCGCFYRFWFPHISLFLRSPASFMMRSLLILSLTLLVCGVAIEARRKLHSFPPLSILSCDKLTSCLCVSPIGRCSLSCVLVCVFLSAPLSLSPLSSLSVRSPCRCVRSRAQAHAHHRSHHRAARTRGYEREAVEWVFTYVSVGT